MLGSCLVLQGDSRSKQTITCVNTFDYASLFIHFLNVLYKEHNNVQARAIKMAEHDADEVARAIFHKINDGWTTALVCVKCVS